MAAYIIQLILEAFLVCLFARVLLSYFPISPGSVMAHVQRAAGVITDPVLVPIRRVVPPVSLGDSGAVLDMSPIIVFVLIFILREII